MNERKLYSGGKGAQCTGNFFDGVVRQRGAGRERCLLGREHGTPLPPRSRRPTATALLTRVSQLERRFILKLKEHILDKLFDARLGRSISSCSNTKCSSSPVMSSASWCIVWGYGNSGQLYSSAAFFSYPIIVYFTAGVAGAFSALHHMLKAWCKQKKSVGSWFDAESVPLGWGALVKDSFELHSEGWTIFCS